MSNSAMILVESDGRAEGGRLVDAVMAHWPQRDRPPLRRLTVEAAMADEKAFDLARCVWFIVEDADCFAVRELMLRAQDHFCAAMVTRFDESLPIGTALAAGVLAAPAAAPAVALCAMARALWNQSDIVRALRAEIDLLQAHNGGLATQFDKLDEELRMAAQLQRDFLPASLPDVKGVDFRVIFRPASYVSGDIYDVIRFDDHRIGFFIADAVGHGVPAALMTVYIKRSLRTGKRADDSSREFRIFPPHEALQHLNRDMIRQQQGTVRFATACYGIIDTRTNELSFARAGHPYPLLLRADGKKEWLDVEGGLLGVFPDEEFSTMRVQLDPGDRLLLYSDGFELAFGDAIQQNGQRRRIASRAYTEEFEALAHGSLDDAFTHLSKRLDEQAGSLNQIDDLTAVLIQVGEPARPPFTAPEPSAIAMAV